MNFETEADTGAAVDFEAWKAAFCGAVLAAFGERIVCAGVQGSRARGEAGEKSDIDAVLILDRLTPADLVCYRSLAAGLPHAGLMCGFVSGKAELFAWDAADLVSFYFDTVCLIGSLGFLQARITPEAARRSVHLSACGLYHALCHAAVFEPEPLSPRAFAKAAFFLMRTQRYLETGKYPLRLSALLPLLNAEERALLRPLGRDFVPADASGFGRAALAWCTQMIMRYTGQ